MAENSQPGTSLPFYLTFGGFWILLNAGLIVCTVLKEVEMFWRNEGGYPDGLREAILTLYYPYFLLTLTFQAFVTAVLVHGCLKNPVPDGFYRILSMAPAWILTAVAVVLLLANNISNLLNGRPFHWHSGSY